MQKLKNRFVTRSQILRLAPLLLCTTAGAAPVLLNEASTTNTWTLPSGPNLIDGNTTLDVPPTGHGNNDVTSGTWATATDGQLGLNTDLSAADAPNNNTSVTFPLDLSTNTNGYTLTQFDSYCAWQDGGRINQDYSLSYSTVNDPATFLPLTTVSNDPAAVTPTNVSTHTKITDSTGALATGVYAIRLTFANQQNGYVGYREFILQGTPVAVGTPLTWSGVTNGNWTTVVTDNNWKTTLSPFSSAKYDPISDLTFGTGGINHSITIPGAITAGSATFSNGLSAPYTFGGVGPLSVTRGITANNSGAVTFSAPLTVGAGIAANGTGNLSFGGALQTNALAFQGGIVNLTSASPSVGALSGLDGTLTLGNTSPVVNTVVSIGNATNSEYDGVIQNAPGAKGGVTKVGTGVLVLNGINTYTGVTTASGGQLDFATPGSLYNGLSTSWTAANLIATPGGALVFRAGGFGEFADSDFLAINTGGFQAGSFLGIDTFSDDLTLTSVIGGQEGLLKAGPFSLNLTTVGTYAGPTKIVGGALNAANPSGISIPGNVIVGDGTDSPFLHMAFDNQLPPTAVITFASGTQNAKFQLRGTSQTIAGLDSPTTNTLAILQNDEAGTPGAGATPIATPATLTINATSDHSFAGLIRNSDGGPLAIVKNGPGTQEFINIPIQSDSSTGGVTINQGAVKFNFSGANTGFGSAVHIASGANLLFDGTFAWGAGIDGAGHVAKQGTGTLTKISVTDTYSGGTSVDGGILNLAAPGGAPVGEGIAANEPGILGVKNASNPIVVNSGATLMLNSIAPLGNSGMLPQFGYSVTINGGTLSGGTNPVVAFVTNLTLNGGKVDITNGSDIAGFNTNLGLVGTVIVSGTTPSTISTSGTGANANVSLGDGGLLGTTFQVADVTGNASDDLLVSSIFQNVLVTKVCSLTKTGPGTMHLTATNTYTGDTIVNAGTLIIDQPYLADSSNVTIGSTATLSLTHGQPDTVATLTIGGTQMAAGTYVAANVTTPGTIPTARITGTGSLVVTTGPGATGGYDAWSAQITDTTQRDRTADPDKDGYTNIQEYLFGTSPIASNGSLVTSTSTPGNLVIHWNQLSTPGTTTYVVQESTDLVTWTTSTAVVSDDPVQNTANYTLKQATIPVSGVRKFVRVVGNE
jgi:autotransporter-associated beta strand protein